MGIFTVIISITVFVICPTIWLSLLNFSTHQVVQLVQKNIFANLCQDHDGLVATSSVSSFTFPEPWILTSNPSKLNTFQALPYYSVQVMLPDLAGSGNAGSGVSHMVCRSRWKQRHFQTGPGEREREKERVRLKKQCGWKMHTYRKGENPALEYNSVGGLYYLGPFWVIFEAHPAY